MTVVDRPATYREVFAEPSFRALFTARTLAIGATSLQIFALSVLVYAGTGSPLLSALAFGAGFLPQVVGGMLLGSLTDRLSPRPLIVAGYTVEAGLAAALGWLDLPVAASLTLVAVVACGTPVFAGAAARVIAERLTGDAYVLGRSVSNMSSSTAQLLGLAGGGVAVATLGARTALLCAAGCHVAAAVIVRFGLPAAGASGAGAKDGAGRGGAVRDSWTGAVALLSDRTIRRLLLAQWLPSALAAGAEALLVAYGAGRGFAAGSGALLMAAPALGMLAGNFGAGRCMRPSLRERSSPWFLLVLGTPLIALLAGPPLPVAVGLLVVAGTGFAYGLGLQRAFLAAAPEDRRGQLFALLSTGLMALQGVGPLVLGAVAEVTSPAVAIAVAGAATVLVAPSLRRPRHDSV
ncbi:MFS transporter [Dactylosporangium aurantiacum]|uniref:MFS transporter n=1 Tax=Dactylosporangium aurantiacum TaxID=35754 RepID=A0A9Q9MS50_9ACTN|nr:MFS transporter [Dactylosporangium aurantiacum]MDG6108641.1 MFS transporter [Dactylosporangium aurantiacum]UWZ59142.1 MFS transporter [Dactylosporangium aurantiacum]